MRLNLNFEPVDGAAHVFTLEGWRTLLLKDELISRVEVARLAFSNISFATKDFRVEPWVDEPASHEIVVRTLDGNPRRIVRCRSPEFMPPNRIQPWLVETKPASDDIAWQEWRVIAKEMIARSLPSELYVEAGIKSVGLAGQPPRSIEFGVLDESCTLESLQEAASWVYLEGTDNEVRHTFLTAELAREWPASATFCQEVGRRLALSMESARLLYKAHLRSAGKDTLKALADMRKSLADDVQKTIQQARDLSAAIWRDVALAIGVLAFRLAMDPAKATATSSAFAIIFGAVAAYIALSFWIAVSTNNRFFSEFDKTLQSWRPKLYGFLDDGDYEALAQRPLTGAKAVYRSTERKVTVVVGIVVIVLVFMACVEAGIVSLDDVKGWPATGWTKVGILWQSILAAAKSYK